MAEKFDHLEEHLEKFVENIRQLGIIVSDFQPSSQAGLNQKLNFIVTGLQDIDKCRQQLHDITVPLEVFEYIDQGRNPQLYTKECLERALAKNEQVKGKIDTMKSPGLLHWKVQDSTSDSGCTHLNSLSRGLRLLSRASVELKQ
ncbi:mediator of RNA polymerase II transcription subunit 10 isoform X5 [Ursus maritimus]|uniref:Mediator of RNA polymerase II transcription subunit 10 n=1 Tax=Ursus maritimus TaxID=29073 RepID=A0A8M1FT05_URSMA|nr:mediator of RNA polymerase II transcription subunit 10 isoform X5 [Ursus maritimus]